MSFANKSMKNWTIQDVKQWVLSLNIINVNQKNKIIESVIAESITGDDLYEASKEDLESCLNINGMIATRLLNAIEDIKQKEFDNAVGGGNNNNNCNDNNNCNEEEGSFTVNLQGQKGKITRLDNIYKSYSVARLKEEYLQKFGHEITNEELKGLDMTYLGKHLVNDKTLEYYGIVSHLSLVIVVFKVNGGAECKFNGDMSSIHKVRDSTHPRKLRLKKYKTLKVSKKEDCIMHYTDSDHIKRAEMECGHAIAADTMYRYMKSIFNKNVRAIKIVCPVNKCKTEWKWQHVAMVADLTEIEYFKYTQILSDRKAGFKSCPNCHSKCQRSKSLNIWRVRCTACNKRDWCWECERTWIGSGVTLCGNSNCIAEKLNSELVYSWNNDKVTPKNWSPQVEVPRLRACPECLTLLSYVEKCKHITCVGCPHQYCHICLKKWHTCGSNCSISPAQKFS